MSRRVACLALFLLYPPGIFYPLLRVNYYLHGVGGQVTIFCLLSATLLFPAAYYWTFPPGCLVTSPHEIIRNQINDCSSSDCYSPCVHSFIAEHAILEILKSHFNFSPYPSKPSSCQLCLSGILQTSLCASVTTAPGIPYLDCGWQQPPDFSPCLSSIPAPCCCQFTFSKQIWF